MYNPELYHKANYFQRKASIDCLDEYSKRIKWNKGDQVIDLGCADGNFTAILRDRYLPRDIKKLVACDISEKMVQFANKSHGNETTEFIVWDVRNEVPLQFREDFNHVFSFFALHWIKNQEKAFQNIYDILTEGGDCLLAFLGHLPLYAAFKILARNDKWKSWLPDLESYLSPYHNMQDPDKKIKQIMETIGFKNIDVQCKDTLYVFENFDQLKETLKGVEPYNMPKDIYDAFMRDYHAVVHDLGMIETDKHSMEEIHPIHLRYSLIVVYATK